MAREALDPVLRRLLVAHAIPTLPRMSGREHDGTRDRAQHRDAALAGRRVEQVHDLEAERDVKLASPCGKRIAGSFTLLRHASDRGGGTRRALVANLAGVGERQSRLRS